MKQMTLILMALTVLGALVAGCQQPATDTGTTTTGTTAGTEAPKTDEGK